MNKEILMTQIDNYVFGAIAVIGAVILFFMMREFYIKNKLKDQLDNDYKSFHK